MKTKLLMIVLACFCLLPVNAQQWKFGIEAGGNWSHYREDKSQAEQVGNMGIGFQLGGTVDYEFKHHWMLMSGLSFMQTRSNMMLFNAMMPLFPDTEIKVNHLNIPIKVGFNIRISKNFSLIPYIGAYGSINFNAGNCDVKNPYTGKTDHWKPMDGYSYLVPPAEPDMYEYEARLNTFRRWNYGTLGGLKAVIANHYTVSLQYNESIKKVQKQCNLRNYGYLFSVGYQF